MRHLIFKKYNYPKDCKKMQEISVEEITEKYGVTATTMKKSIYFVVNVKHMNSREEMQKWLEDIEKNPKIKKKFFSIFRRRCDKDQIDDLRCKMRGSFFLIKESDVFDVVFIHSIKISLRGKKI